MGQFPDLLYVCHGRGDNGSMDGIFSPNLTDCLSKRAQVFLHKPCKSFYWEQNFLPQYCKLVIIYVQTSKRLAFSPLLRLILNGFTLSSYLNTFTSCFIMPYVNLDDIRVTVSCMIDLCISVYVNYISIQIFFKKSPEIRGRDFYKEFLSSSIYFHL